MILHHRECCRKRSRSGRAPNPAAQLLRPLAGWAANWSRISCCRFGLLYSGRCPDQSAAVGHYRTGHRIQIPWPELARLPAKYVHSLGVTFLTCGHSSSRLWFPCDRTEKLCLARFPSPSESEFQVMFFVGNALLQTDNHMAHSSGLLVDPLLSAPFPIQ